LAFFSDRVYAITMSACIYLSRMMLDIDFSRLLLDWQRSYYSGVLMFLLEAMALIMGLRYAKKDRVAQFLIVYIIFDLIILFSDWYVISDASILKEFRSGFILYTNALVYYFEFSFYIYFFSKLFNRKVIKKLLFIFFLIITVLTILFLLTKFSFISNRSSYLLQMIWIFGLLGVLFLCIYYFIQLFASDLSMPLQMRPSFWIVLGIFFYALISIPYFLISRHLIRINSEIFGKLAAVFFYIPYAMNFIFLSKAFLCKKPLTT
jgi:hypothetical protein